MASNVAQDLQEQYLGMVRKSQEIALDAIKTLVDAVQGFTPKLPSVDLPFAEWLPKPEEVVSTTYDFAEQWLRSQRQFADEVVKAAAGLLPGAGDSKVTDQ